MVRSITQGVKATMSFDIKVFQQLLSTHSFGRPLHHFETVGSTNTALWELLAQGATPGTAVIAVQQQSGRGQWGRTWVSPPGGLYLSVAIAPNIPADQTPQLTLCSAWGVATHLRNSHIPVKLKWPNDLMLQGWKLGGILTETSVQQGTVTTAVIGIGINWLNQIPPGAITVYPPQTDLTQKPIQSLESLAAEVLQGLETGYCHWQAVGLQGILPEYVHLLQIHATAPAIEPGRDIVLNNSNWV